MSIEVVNWVLNHSDTKAGDRLVLLGIAESAEHDGSNAWPSVATLAKRANMTTRAVQYALRRLEDAGHLRVELNAGGSLETRADRRTNRYSVVMHGVKPASSRSGHGVKTATPRGENDDIHGVKPASPESSLKQPSLNRPKNLSLDPFEEFWRNYPRRIGKLAARKAWNKRLKAGDTDEGSLIVGARRYAEYHLREGTDPHFIKHPATWLNAGCERDELVSLNGHRHRNASAFENVRRKMGMT